MVIFKRISYKNFLSSGNDPIEIDLSSHPRTLVMGTNGAGKSTMISALTFGLFGKDFRKINKPQLVNSINGKNLLVEVEFFTKGKTYLIRRGIKPAIFEIYMDGVLINQTASSKDYQAYIEENVLNLNFESFKQIVVLGSNNYVPFMRLPGPKRREIIEDLLDISVFSRMNSLLKDQMTDTRERIKDADDYIRFAQEKITMNEQFLDSIEKQKQDRKEKAREEINRLLENNELSHKQIEELLVKKAEVDGRKDKFDLVDEKRSELETSAANIQRLIKDAHNKIKFFSNHDHCPTCKQNINAEFKAEEIKVTQKACTEHETKLAEESEKLEKLNAILEKKQAVINALMTINNKVSELQSSIHVNSKFISKLENDLLNDTHDEQQEELAKKNLKQAKRSKTEHTNTKQTLLLNRETENVVAMMLKDTGLKTAIIRKYIPYMNELINDYLSAMDFYVSFNLDENFQESIKSRYRDEFSYENFSEGEKQRIDLAILFAWRQIARKKNSMATNLLILDEVGDSSLDEEGIKYVFEILRSMGEETNIIVISHRENMVDNFDRVLKVSKKGNFSSMEVF